jgi:hypothetical protein
MRSTHRFERHPLLELFFFGEDGSLRLENSYSLANGNRISTVVP